MALAPHYWPKQVTRTGQIQGTWKQIHLFMGRKKKQQQQKTTVAKFNEFNQTSFYCNYITTVLYFASVSEG